MYLKIKDDNGETVSMHETMEKAEEALEELESDEEESEKNYHITDFR